MHLAAATGTPTIGLFGPTPAQLYGPWGKNCRAVATDTPYEELAPLLRDSVEKHYGLMETLPVDKVLQAARDMLARG